MTKKVAISTWCTDDYVDLIGLDKLHNSIKYFHPEIDHVIVDSKMTKEIEKEIPWMKNIWMMAPSCLPLADEYDMVIHLDGDAVVTGPLDEMINSTAEIIGVRNNNSLNQAGAHDGITIRHMQPFGNGSDIPLQGFINAGMIAAQGKDFWEDWHDVNSQVADVTNKGFYNPGWGDENDTLNDDDKTWYGYVRPVLVNLMEQYSPPLYYIFLKITYIKLKIISFSFSKS